MGSWTHLLCVFAHLNPQSSDFRDIRALHSPFLHQLTMQYSLFEPGRLRPCPSYGRRRDRIGLGLLRSYYKGGGGGYLHCDVSVGGSTPGDGANTRHCELQSAHSPCRGPGCLPAQAQPFITSQGTPPAGLLRQVRFYGLDGMLSQATSEGLRDGLVTHWPLDEGEGTRGRDVSGHETHAEIANPTWAVGPDGVRAALQLSEGQSRVHFPKVTPLIPVGNSAYSISVWVKKPGVHWCYVIFWGEEQPNQVPTPRPPARRSVSRALQSWGDEGQGGFLVRRLVDGAGSYSVAHRASFLLS